MTPETRVKIALKKYIVANGGWVVKLHADGMQGRGTIDLLGGYRGRPFYVEVKAPDGTVEPAQQFQVDRASRTGFVAGIVASAEEFEQLFTDYGLTE